MATRVPPTNPNGQAGLRGGSGNRGPVDDGTVFRSMKEFWFWVLIVTFLIALLGFSITAALYADKQVRKAEAILLRAEQLEKEKKNDRRKKEPHRRPGQLQHFQAYALPYNNPELLTRVLTNLYDCMD